MKKTKCLLKEGGEKIKVMSYVQSLYHVVFRTYRSEPVIEVQQERELYAYLYNVATNARVKVYRIGGMPDHIHMLVDLPPSMSIATFMQQLKVASSKWMKENRRFPNFRGWAKEYAALSYSLRDKEMIVNYIKGQKEHHKKTTFAEEYRAFLEAYGVEVKEEYFLRDE